MRKATARRMDGRYKHSVTVRSHDVTVDETQDAGGEDAGPDPQEMLAVSLASCVAITVEMYAQRKAWNIGDVECEVEYEPAQRGSPTKFHLILRLPKELPEDQRERLMQIAAKCPVHRTLEGEVMFDESLELN